MQNDNVLTETVSVLLPCPDYDAYARSTELGHEQKYGASLHDAIRLLMRTLCLDFTKNDCYDELLNVVMDNFDGNAVLSRMGTDVTQTDDEKAAEYKLNLAAAKAFVSEIITAADIYMARTMLNMKRMDIGNLVDVNNFLRLNQETYRVDFTRTIESNHDNADNEVSAPCLSETNDLDDLEESRGFVLMRSSQSTRSTLEQIARRR